MKKLFISLALFAGLYVQAQDSYLTAAIGALTNNISTNRMVVKELSLATGTNAVTISFYDNNVSGNTNITSLYYTTSATSGYVTNIWTNDYSVVLTNRYVGLITSTVTNAAATNALPALTTLIVPANTTVTRSVSLIVGKGLTYASDGSNATLTVTYKPW